MSKKWKVEVRVFNDPQWYSNAMRYDSEEQAEAAGKDLWSRWTMAQEYRVVEAT